jgi:hypothetical protein
MITGDYRDLFAAIATASAGLIGLLFVAISVAPRRNPTTNDAVVREVRASAALLAFTNALAVSLFGLVPDQNVGYPATVLGVIGVFFTLASMRSLFAGFAAKSDRELHNRRQLVWILSLLVIFGFELAGGILLLLDSRSGHVGLISNLLVTSLLVGVARAWELVGHSGTGIVSSLTVLAGRGEQRRPLPEASDTDGDVDPARDRGSPG